MIVGVVLLAAVLLLRSSTAVLRLVCVPYALVLALAVIVAIWRRRRRDAA